MTNYAIEEFWIPQLGQEQRRHSSSLVQGWEFVNEGLSTFKEAPLVLNEEYSEGINPVECSVLLVSAPGAVGKSTLARQIAFRTGSVYINLAESEPVGGNTLSGGLARSGLFSLWEKNRLTVMIDGLDEAKLKVSEGGFQAFLSDIGELSKERQIQTVVFGRTKVVEDAWLYIPGDYRVAVLEIGYYGDKASVEFAEMTLLHRHPERLSTASVDRQALKLLLERLRSETEGDENRFAGYAPVLQAVAERVASEANPINLINELEAGGQPPLTLQSITLSILLREQGKLNQIELQDRTLPERLYTPDEQLHRLVARTYQTALPALPKMSPEDLRTYSEKVEPWLEDHPFLGGGDHPRSAVFEAAIKAQALKHETAGLLAAQRELEKGELANPFLYLFYSQEDQSEPIYIRGEHIGVYYNSLRASLANGEKAFLVIEDDEDDSTHAMGEMEIVRRGIDDPIQMRFLTDRHGPIRLGHHVRDTDIYMPSSRVEIGPSAEVTLVAPVSIVCRELAVATENLRAEARTDAEVAIVDLHADVFDGSRITKVPETRNVTLVVSWPGAEAYPWHSFRGSYEPMPEATPQIEEALRRFRMFVLSFRSDKARSLGRHQDKIEGTRMVKGTGQAVLKLMMHEGIVTRNQARYSLNSNRLAELTSMSYSGFLTRNFTVEASELVRKALSF